MSHRPLLFAIVLRSLIVCPSALATQPLRIVIIGDSTVSEYPASRPDRGWVNTSRSSFGPAP
jgi:hypothetical protein